MKKQTTAMLAFITALGLGGAVMAQETTPPATTDTTGSTPDATTTTTTTAGASGAMGTGILASSLIGMTVYSASGEQIGEVNDIVLQPQSGQANTAIIGVGGFLGIGKKDVAVDMAQIQLVRGADDAIPRLTLNTSKDQLNAAPSFDRSTLGQQGKQNNTTGTTVPQTPPQQ